MASILVVDDERGIREIAVRALVHHGHDAMAVSGGRAALGVVSDDHFDVILSDIHMPEGDGIELIRALRSRGIKARIIAMTGALHDLSIDLHRVWGSHGADEVIAKPFRIAELLQLIDRLVPAKDRYRSRPPEMVG
jgi:CheY-like chemotaxis protein